jgi:hypothetical protein
MGPRQITTFRLDTELLAGLREVWDRDGIQPSEQVRRAIRAWLVEKGVRVEAPRPRKRSAHSRSGRTN